MLTFPPSNFLNDTSIKIRKAVIIPIKTAKSEKQSAVPGACTFLI